MTNQKTFSLFRLALATNTPTMTTRVVLPLLLLFAVVALGLSGCAGRLDLTRTKVLSHEKGEPGTEFILDPQPAEQTLTVEITSAEPVDVFIVTADKQANYERETAQAKRAEAATASKLGMKSGTVSATIPAKTETKVYVRLPPEGKETEVKVRLTNRK